jgi:hypothetical protein
MRTDELPALERLRLVSWAIERSDDLRIAYASRGSIVLAAAGSIAAGVAIFIKAENLALLRQYTLSTVLWLAALLLGVLWCTWRAIWHVIRATTAVSRQRDNIGYSGAKRFWLNLDDTIGTRIEREGFVWRALFPSTHPRIVLPSEEQLLKIGMMTPEELLPGFVGELAFVLAVQSRRYQRLGWAVVSVASGFVLYLLFLATWAVLMYRAF